MASKSWSWRSDTWKGLSSMLDIIGDGVEIIIQAWSFYRLPLKCDADQRFVGICVRCGIDGLIGQKYLTVFHHQT